MVLSIIVAASENNVIGRDNTLIWHLSADLKRFKTLTTGHTLIMGRKTFQSIGKALPNRRNIVITHNPDFQAAGCEIAPGIPEALSLASTDDLVFIIGGGSLYQKFWNQVDCLYLTLVHTTTTGDTYIPAIEPSQWEEISRQDFPADEKNEFAYSFINYQKR